MEENTHQWLWLVDDDLVRAALAVEPEDPGLLRRAVAHPALGKAMRARLRGTGEEALSALAPALAQCNPDAINLAAQIHFEANRMEEAGELYEQLSELQPGQAAPAFNRGLCLARLRQWPAAVDCLQKAVLLAPDKPEVWYCLGICMLNQRRGAEAKAAFAYSLKLRADYAPAWFGQAAALQVEQKHRDALEIYERLLDKQPECEELIANALSAAVAIEDRDRIHSLAARLLALRPASIPALLALASVSVAERNFEEGTRWCALLTEREPACYDHWYNLGLCLLRLGDPGAAQDAFSSALRLDSEGLEAWTGLAQSAAADGRPDLALEAWQSVVRLDPERVDAWFQLGILYTEQGEDTRAAEAFERCAALEPGGFEAWLNLGVCRRKAGRAEAAEAAFEKALALGGHPGAAAALVSLAVERGDLEAALRRQAEFDVKDPDALFDLAVLCQKERRLEEAAGFYSRVLELRPEFPEAEFNLGSVSFSLGRDEEGNQRWRKALEKDPGLARHLAAAWKD